MKNTELELQMQESVTAEDGSDKSNVVRFSDILRELRRNVEPHLVRHREARWHRGGKTKVVDYVEWHTVADILDEIAPNWAHTVKEINVIGSIMTITVAITIDGVTREGIGTGSADSEMGIKKAEHDGLKRAAVKFGIARDLYKKEFDDIQSEAEMLDTAIRFPADPIAKNLRDMVTSKQLSMIRALGRELGLSTDSECVSVMNCRADELSKQAGSSFIAYLQEFQRQAGDSSAVRLRRAS
ncbi:MAG: Rad52/Rad22 family DNA repair protein [Pyrinomonadaceae bacterium]